MPEILLRRVLPGVVLALTLTAFYAGYLFATGNFHVVLPGQLYRSAQLRAGDTAFYARRYGIRTIINLRGQNADAGWYDMEIKEAKAAEILHIDFPMSAKKIMSYERAAELIKLMKAAPKPILLHCEGGANRTGLATALYLAAVNGDTEDAAEFQLSIFFGNLPRWLDKRNRASDNFELLEPMLGFKDS